MKPARNKALLCTLGLLFSGAAWALSSDRNQPLQIDADHADIDQQRGVSTYSGNVQLTRGSMHLVAGQLVVQHEGGTVRLVVATGSPVNYRQQSDNKQQITARALRMEYHIDTGQLLLLQQAELHQDDNVFASDRIAYDSVKDRVNAGTTTESSRDRVHIIIQPGHPPNAPAAPQ